MVFNDNRQTAGKLNQHTNLDQVMADIPTLILSMRETMATNDGLFVYTWNIVVGKWNKCGANQQALTPLPDNASFKAEHKALLSASYLEADGLTLTAHSATLVAAASSSIRRQVAGFLNDSYLSSISDLISSEQAGVDMLCELLLLVAAESALDIHDASFK
jgi:hypothetical protein